MFDVVSWAEFLARTGMAEAEFEGYLDAGERDLVSGLPRSYQHLHDGETLFVRLDGTVPWGDAGFPVELWGAHGQAGNGEMAALSRRNGLHFFEGLEEAPAPAGYVDVRTPRLLMAIGARESVHEEFAESFAAIEAVKSRFRGWEVVGSIVSFNEQTLVDSIERGIDAIVFVAHGEEPTPGAAELVFGGDKASVPWAALGAGLSKNPRPLRFAFVMACDLYRPIVATLRSLAAGGRLHPHFGGVVVRGSPGMGAGVAFAGTLLDTLVLLGEHEVARTGEDRALAQAAPLAYAIQEARRRVWRELSDEDPARGREKAALEAARARLVLGTPFVRPLPVGLELERERYLASLAAGLKGAGPHA